MRAERTSLIAATCLAIPLLLGGCAMNRDAREYTSLRVSDVDLGRNIDTSNRITDESDDFRQNETIYAVVETQGAGSGSLMVRWYNEDQQYPTRQRTVAIGPGETLQVFTLAPADGLRPGRWRLEVYLNGTFIEAEDFRVHS